MRLSERYASMTPAERERLAKKAKMSVGYLYQLSRRWNRGDRNIGRRPSFKLLCRLAAADKSLTVEDMVKEFAE